MITLIETNEPDPGRSVRVRQRRTDQFEFSWHKHAEYELTVISSSSGRRFVGDHVGTYEPGDLVLIGPMLPHTWVSDGPGDAVATVIHFVDPVPDGWPEANLVRELLAQSAAGTHFSGTALVGIRSRLCRLHRLPPLSRLLSLIEVLDELAASQGVVARALAHLDDAAGYDALDDRIEGVLAHVSERFRVGITQRECAELVGIDPSAFCRLFKRSMHRTFTQYVNELRTNEACRLLVTTGDSVTSIAFDTGFDNLSYFNRVFRRMRGMSPSDYRRSWGSTAMERTDSHQRAV